MKNSKLVKIVLIIMISLAVIIVSKNVFAAETTKQSLADGTLTGTTTSGSSTGTGTSTSGSSTGTSTSTSGSSTGTSTSISGSGTGTSALNNNTVLTTSNTSNYNNTSLPKTGVEDSMPIVVLSVVLGISAIYAYKKIQDYKNI